MTARFTIMVALLFVAKAPAIDPGRVAVGDKLYVAVDGAELHANGKKAARLKRMTELRVLEVRDQWVGGAVVIDGQQKKGWLALVKVFKPDDPRDLAALKAGSLRLEPDHSGNVLEVAALRQKITDKDLGGLKGLYSLESLDLSETTIVDDDLKRLRGLTNLRRLYLTRTALGDRGLDALATLSRLEVLALGHTRISGPGLARLGSLRHLHVLNLSGCRIDDDDLQMLGQFKNLRVLALDQTPLQGAGLGHLKRLEHLNLLNLSGCKLEKETVLSLRGLNELRALYLDRTALDDATERQLNRLLPRLAVIKGGAR